MALHFLEVVDPSTRNAHNRRSNCLQGGQNPATDLSTADRQWADTHVMHCRSVPLVIGQFLEMVDSTSGIVGSTTGSNYYVRILSTLNRYVHASDEAPHRPGTWRSQPWELDRGIRLSCAHPGHP